MSRAARDDAASSLQQNAPKEDPPDEMKPHLDITVPNVSLCNTVILILR